MTIMVTCIGCVQLMQMGNLKSPSVENLDQLSAKCIFRSIFQSMETHPSWSLTTGTNEFCYWIQIWKLREKLSPKDTDYNSHGKFFWMNQMVSYLLLTESGTINVFWFSI